ncbi:hypothetical protein [Salipaludibacillus agaradhaerens]|uniref:hypothetical protein n=1 Tax=Salipaludibacillus agaradhaerens TaxID=76935 RepID=UPI002151CF35|nr:hypothetical protein [Salipaludibacillus agaradhaerens]
MNPFHKSWCIVISERNDLFPLQMDTFRGDLLQLILPLQSSMAFQMSLLPIGVAILHSNSSFLMTNNLL